MDKAAFREGNLVWGRVVPDIPDFCRELVAALERSSERDHCTGGYTNVALGAHGGDVHRRHSRTARRASAFQYDCV